MPKPNPLLGVLLHAVGGVGAASFYFPFTRVRHWAWETYWLVGGLMFWLVCPWVAAYCTVPGLCEILGPAPLLVKLVTLGAVWGIGNLTFGLSLRYLGMSLGMTLTLGFCMLAGTLAPPILHGTLKELSQTASGQIALAGIAIGAVGIALCGLAGMRKERELTSSSTPSTVTEFHFTKGAILAAIAGVMSACFAFAIDAGEELAEKAAAQGAEQVWRNGPTIALILSGGALTNIAWCLMLNFRNRTISDYVDVTRRSFIPNYLLCFLAGAIAFSEFLFFGMGESQMGAFRFSSWSIHMSFVVVFSNLWGLVLAEWRGTGHVTRTILISGLTILVAATVVIGYGAYLKAQSSPESDHELQPAVEALSMMQAEPMPLFDGEPPA